MMEAPLVIGKYKDVLPPSHVERKLTKVLIDVKFLENISENTIALVDCVTDVKSFKQFSPNLIVSKVKDTEIIQTTTHLQKICACGKAVSQENFSSLCKKNLEIQFHHFRYLDNHRLEWMESGNYGLERKCINELQKFRLQSEFMEYTIGEGQYFNHSRQNINIICADAGMGKSTLAKSLKKSSKSTNWIILIYTRDHALHFKKHGSSVKNFLKYILENTLLECWNQFHHRVFQKMMENNQIQLIWDGLDEASDDTQISILTLVNAFSEKGVKQWLTSRINLRDMLENMLELLATNGANFNIPDKDGQLPIHYACRNYRKGYEIILFLLENGVKVDVLDGDGRLPIHYAFQKFDTDTIILLVQHGTRVDVPDGDGRLPIHYACQHGSLKLIELLAVKGAKFDVPDRGGQLPIHYACRNFSEGYEIILFLCKKGVKVDVPDGDGRLPIHYACEQGRLKMVNLLEANGAKFDVPDRGGQPLMHFACRNFWEGYEIILFLCKEDIKLDVSDGDGRLPTHYACEHGSLTMVELLATNGAKFDVPDSGGQLPMHFACRNFSEGYEIIVYLCTKGVKVDVPDGDGRLPIHYACEQGRLSMVQLLATNGAKFDVPDSGGRLPMHYACRNDQCGYEIILFLCKNGEKVDVPDGDGRLPIHYACEHGRLTTVELLATKGAKFDVPDRGGQLPIHCACRNNRWGYEITLYLCKKGVKADIPDGDGRLHYAFKRRRLNIIELRATNETKFDVVGRGGQLPMHYASRNLRTGHLKTLFLYKKCVEVNVLDQNGRLPIHYACEQGWLDMVELLATNGGKLDIPDRDGQLPMHYACRNRSGGYEIILFLCKNGGKLPIDYACKNRNFDISKHFHLNIVQTNAEAIIHQLQYSCPIIETDSCEILGPSW
ncbi:serine/threonine-protein phosphatase 6 regulatory ankyrin repeat subunit B-like [Zophobas morio]|uniref:serine/threonine-protein phosphatase 6 regulatory ankyrin repeat subunit B-like n=1 Tax=Zophobas morio TaxID=2755281 RepID=UPI0030839BEB